MAGAKTKYLIGTSGWNYQHWKKRFYPEDIPKKDWFSHYARNFNTVEVNYSFYRWPSEKTMRKWHDDAPHDFSFTMKAPRTITHIRKLKNVERQVKDFYKLTSLLKDKCGCHLFQLPPSMSFERDNLARLKDLLEALDGRKDNAIEFRHKSWWDPEVYGLLKQYNAAFCIVSGLGMPKDLEATADTAYFRFHGEGYSTRYSAHEIKEYAERMEKLKCRKIYAYFNNDYNAYAVKNAQELRKEIGTNS
ncbi:MAG: DUF72 domain-containing protein [Candidatus Woesearchaeota archaeon]